MHRVKVPAGLSGIAVLALGFGVLSTLALPARWGRLYPVTISIRATGSGNPASKSTEIWITRFGRGWGVSELVSGGSFEPGWELRDDALVSYQRQPSTARWKGYIDSDFVIVFVRHPWSGIAEVAVNGRGGRQDLYSADGANLVFRPLDHVDTSVRPVHWPRILEGLALMVSLTVAWGLLGTWVLRSHRNSVGSDEIGINLGFWQTIALGLPSLLVYSIVHLGVWPALMTEDSINEWFGARAGQVSETFTALHMVLVLALSRIWRSPAIVIAVQILALSGATALVLRELSKWRVPKRVLWTTALLFPLFPANFLMATTLWKDVAYAVGMMLVFRYLLEVLRTNAAALRGWCFRLEFIASLLIVDLTRHNGLFVAGPVALLTGLLFLRSGQFRFFATTGVACLALPPILHLLVNPAVGVLPLPKEYNAGVAVHVIGAMVANGVRFAPDEEEVIASVMPREEWGRAYNCQNSARLFWNKSRTSGSLEENAPSLNRIAFQAIRRHPSIFAKHERCLTAIIWQIMPWGQDWLAIPPIGIVNANGVTPPGLRFAPKVSTIHEIVKSIRSWSLRPSIVWLTWRPAIYLFLLVFLTTVLVLVRRDHRYWCLAAPGLLNSLSLVPFLGSQDYRYQHGMVATVLLTLPLIFSRAGSLLTEGARSPVRVQAPDAHLSGLGAAAGVQSID